jgi:two-component system sensor histidine kinase EvgS
MKRHLLRVSTVLLLFLLSPAMAADGPVTLSAPQRAWLKAHPTLVAGVATADDAGANTAPDGTVRGIGRDYLRVLTDRLGVAVTERRYPDVAAAQAAACRGEVDVLLNVRLTAGRTRCVVYTDAYLDAPSLMVARKGDRRPASLRGLRGLKVVAEPDPAMATNVAAQYPGAVWVASGSSSAALRRVVRGEADVYLGSAYRVGQLLDAPEFSSLGVVAQANLPRSPLHFAVPNAKQPLAEALDAALATLSSQERQAIDARWLATEWTTGRPIALTPGETAALKRRLRVGFARQWAPVSFTEDGQASGLAGAYLDLFTAQGATVELVPADDWAAMERLASDGRIDAIWGVPVGPRRALEGWVFSEPFLSIPNVIVTRVGGPAVLDLADLKHRRVLLSDSARLGPLVQARAPTARIVHTAGTASALDDLVAGKADVYVGNLAVVDAALQRGYRGRLVVAAPTGLNDDLALAVRAPYADEVSVFNRLLASLTPAERERIRGDWLATQYTGGVQWREVLRWAVPIALLLLGGALVQALNSARMRGEARQRRAAEARLLEVSSTLPGVMYQARRDAAGVVSFPFMAGDVWALFGIPAAAALEDERQLFARIHPDDQPQISAVLAHLTASEAPIEADFRAQAPGGWRWIRTHAQRHPSGDGAIVWSGYWIDVTDTHAQADALQAAKDTAERATAAKADFLAVMSHEIRTPMSGIMGLLEMLGHSSLDARQRQTVATIEESAAMLRRILDDILDYSRIEAGQMPLLPRPLLVSSLVQGVVQTLSSMAEAKGVALAVEVGAQLAPVHVADGDRLRQILFNLIGNAIKFTPQGSVRVVLDAQAPREGVQTLTLHVIDTGIGISPEAQARLFQPFTQATAGTAQTYGGTGLGLAITQRLVALMDGEVALASAPGQGTTVSVTLVLALGDPALVPAIEAVSAVEAAPAHWQGRRVLVADDNVTNRMLMAWRLEQLGLDHKIVDDGQQALDALQDAPFDVLITDCQMPHVDGYTLARRIRETEAQTGAPRLPIIALTANASSEEAERCIGVGMDGWVAKPASLDQIRQVLATWLPGQAPPAKPLAALARPPIATATLPSQSDLIGRFGSKAMLDRIVEATLSEADRDLPALREAVEAEDAAAVAALLHRLAGGIVILGAEALSGRAAKLIAAVRTQGVGPQRGSLLDYAARLTAYLDDLRPPQ